MATKIDFVRTPDGSQRILDANLKVVYALAIPVFTGSPTIGDNANEPGYIGLNSSLQPVYYDGATWLPFSASSVPSGGTTGQVLAKVDGTSYNTQWITFNALPTQTGNAGKALFTDGTNASWTDLSVSYVNTTSNQTIGGSKVFSGLFEAVGGTVIAGGDWYGTLQIRSDSGQGNVRFSNTTNANLDWRIYQDNATVSPSSFMIKYADGTGLKITGDSIFDSLGNAFVKTGSLGSYLPLAGGSLSGDVQQPNTPVNGNSLVNKTYVDGVSSGLNWKINAKVATTANITLSGFQTIDGISVGAGDRVLVKNQTTATNNGPYIVAAGSWTRATDANTSSLLFRATLFISSGTVNANTAWTCTNAAAPTIGTDNITFGQIQGVTSYTQGTGIVISSGAISFDTTYGDGRYLNQNTTGSAAKWTTARTLGGNSVDGSASVPFLNKFIAQGTSDAGLTNAQFLGALATGIVKNTTSTGVLSIATAGTDYQTPLTFVNSGLTNSGGAISIGGLIGTNSSIVLNGHTFTFSDGTTNDQYTIGGGTILMQEGLTSGNHSQFIMQPTNTFYGTYVGGATVNFNFSTSTTQATQGYNAAGGSMLLQFTSTSMKFYDTLNGIGVQYGADYSANFTSLSLVHKGYVDAKIGLTNPMTTSQDIIIGGTSGTPTRLAVGLGGTILGVNPTTNLIEYKTISTTQGVGNTNSGGSLTFFNQDTTGTASDANYTVPVAGGFFLTLPVITANRTISLPSASTSSGKKLTFLNKNTSGSFSWSFTGATVKDQTSTTFTTLLNNTIYVLQSDGTNWYSIASGSSTGAAPLNSPGFTGTPTAPTPITSDNSTTLATTAYVQANFASTAIYFSNSTFSGAGTVASPYAITYNGGITGSSGVVSLDLTYAGTFTGKHTFSVTDIASSGTANYGTVFSHIGNQTSNAGFTDVLINSSGTFGSGTHNLIDTQLAGASKFKVSSAGFISASAGINLGGTVISGIYSQSTTSFDGFFLQNYAAATSGQPNITSPRINLQTNVWNTSGTPASNVVNMIQELQTVSSATPGFNFVWSGRINASGTGAYTPLMNLSSDGSLAILAGVLKLKSYNVGSLPPASSYTGAMTYVNDASSPTWGATLVGGGSTGCLALSNGTNWTAR